MALPKDHHELMKAVLDQIMASSNLPIEPSALEQFEKGNICKFKEQFPNLDDNAFKMLMKAATKHGELSELAAKLKDNAPITVGILPFFWAGKVVRAMTMKGMPLPNPVPEPNCPDTPAPEGGNQPVVVPAGPYCSWPPVP